MHLLQLQFVNAIRFTGSVVNPLALKCHLKVNETDSFCCSILPSSFSSSSFDNKNNRQFLFHFIFLSLTYLSIQGAQTNNKKVLRFPFIYINVYLFLSPHSLIFYLFLTTSPYPPRLTNFPEKFIQSECIFPL